MKSSTKLRYLGISLTLLLIASVLFIFYQENSDSVPAKKNASSAPTLAAPWLPSTLAATQVDTLKLPALSAAVQTAKPAALNEAMCSELANAMKNEKDWPAAKKKLEMDQEKAAQELEQILSMAKQSHEPRSKAAALFLNAQLHAEQVQKKFGQQHPECASDQPCMDEANEAANLARLTEIGEIAKMATHSPDPSLYALAFHACNSLKDTQPGYCSQISAAQWTRRDPENGSAWLFALTQMAAESKGKQNSATEAALFRLSQVKKFDPGLSLLSEFQKSAQSENVFVRPNLTQLEMDVYFGSSLPAYQHILSYCKGEALADANRRHTCDQIADKLVADEGSVIGLAIGLKIGENLTWPAEKIASLREELDAMQELARTGFDGLQTNEASGSAAQALQACLWTVKNTNRIENLMQHGEVRDFKDSMAKQKRSRAELAASYREYKNALKAKAEAEKLAKP